MLRKVAAIRPSELSARDHSHVGFPDWKPHKSPGRPQGAGSASESEVELGQQGWRAMLPGGPACAQRTEGRSNAPVSSAEHPRQDQADYSSTVASQSQTHRPLVETSQGPLGGQETSTLLSLPPPVPQGHSWPL